MIKQLLRQAPGDFTPTPGMRIDGLAENRSRLSRAVVHVVDDDPTVRRAMHALLERLGYDVDTFATAEAFLAAYQPSDVECLLVDIAMPGMDGLQLQRKLRAEGNEIPVIVITGRREIPLAVQAMRAGAVDFLEKPVSGERLIEALERALEAGMQSSEAESIRSEAEGRLQRLTAREREVLDLIVEGLSNKQIAARLKISPRTAENHRARIMEKTGARSLAKLVRMALSAGKAGRA